jgi:hypothetical protein
MSINGPSQITTIIYGIVPNGRIAATVASFGATFRRYCGAPKVGDNVETVAQQQLRV